MLDERVFFWGLVALGALLILFAIWLRSTTPAQAAPVALDSRPANEVVPLSKTTYAADGSIHIEGVVTLNAALPDPDPGDPARDPLEVAGRIAGERGAQAEPWRDESCVEATSLLVARGASLETLERDEGGRTLARLVRALLGERADAERVVRELGAGAHWRSVEAFAVPRWPQETALWAQELEVVPGDVLIDGAARVDSELASALAARHPDPIHGAAVALLATMDAGHDAGTLATRFAELGAEASGAALESWRRYELLRASRSDLDLATALWEEHASSLHGAAQAFATRLARTEPERAKALLARVREASPPFDWLPIARGCALAGLDVTAELDEALAQLTPAAYRPAGVFQLLLDLHLRREDPDAVRRSIAQAGPHAWQTARCAIEAMRALAQKQSPKLGECLDACLARVEPGIVAARDASVGLVAGHAMMRPEWLVFREVHPLELVVLASALDGEAPRWSPPCLS